MWNGKRSDFLYCFHSKKKLISLKLNVPLWPIWVLGMIFSGFGTSDGGGISDVERFPFSTLHLKRGILGVNDASYMSNIDVECGVV